MNLKHISVKKTNWTVNELGTIGIPNLWVFQTNPRELRMNFLRWVYHKLWVFYHPLELTQ